MEFQSIADLVSPVATLGVVVENRVMNV